MDQEPQDLHDIDWAEVMRYQPTREETDRQRALQDSLAEVEKIRLEPLEPIFQSAYLEFTTAQRDVCMIRWHRNYLPLPHPFTNEHPPERMTIAAAADHLMGTFSNFPDRSQHEAAELIIDYCELEEWKQFLASHTGLFNEHDVCGIWSRPNTVFGRNIYSDFNLDPAFIVSTIVPYINENQWPFHAATSN